MDEGLLNTKTFYQKKRPRKKVAFGAGKEIIIMFWCVFFAAIVFLVCLEIFVKYGLYIAIVLSVPYFIGAIIYNWYFGFIEIDANCFRLIKGLKPETSCRIARWIKRKEHYLCLLSSLSTAFVISFLIYGLLKVFII